MADTSSFTTGQEVIYHNGGGSNQSLEFAFNDAAGNSHTGPLVDGGVYYIIVVDATHVELAATASDATASTPNPLQLVLPANPGSGQSLSAVTSMSVPVSFNSQIVSVTVAGSISTEGWAAAASVSLNFIHDNVDVGIRDLGTNQEAYGKTAVNVQASDASHIVTIAGGFGVGAGSVGIGAAVSYNDIANTVQSRIGSAWQQGASTGSDSLDSTTGANVGDVSTEGTLKVSASETATIVNVTLAGSVAPNISVSGALSLNQITDTVIANAGNSGSIQAPKGATFSATDSPTITAVSVAIAALGKVSIGATVAYNDIADQVRAFSDNNNTSGVTQTHINATNGDVDFTATNDASITNVSLGLAIAGVGVGVAGSGSGNVLANVVEAYAAHSDISASGNVLIVASSGNTLNDYGGALGAGTSAGLGGSVVVSLYENKTHAFVSGGSIIAAGGAGTAATINQWDPVTGDVSSQSIHGLAVVAATSETVSVGTGAVGLAGSFGLGANIPVDIATDETLAYIDGASVNSKAAQGGDVIVRAHQSTNVDNVGLAVGVAIFAGLAVAINVDVVDNNTQAYITQSDPTVPTVVYSGTGVDVDATHYEFVKTVAAGAAFGGYAGISGAASGVNLESTTTAYIQSAQVNSGGLLTVEADGANVVKFYDGTVSAAIFVGGGGSASVLLDTENTTAYIEEATTSSASDTDVYANNFGTVNTLVGTGAIGGIAALAGAVSVMSISPTTEAWIGKTQHTNVGSGAAVNVKATDNTTVTDGAGALGGGAVGIGVSIDVITFKNTVSAVIGSNAVVNAVTGVSVDAESTPNVSSTVVSFGGGLAGLNGSISVVSLGTGIDSTSAGQTSQDQSDVNNTLDPNVSSSFNTQSSSSNDPSAAPNGEAANLGSMFGSTADGDHLSVNLNADPTVTGGVTAAIASQGLRHRDQRRSQCHGQPIIGGQHRGGRRGDRSLCRHRGLGHGSQRHRLHLSPNRRQRLRLRLQLSGRRSDRSVEVRRNDRAHAYGGQFALGAGGGEAADITDSSTNSASIGDRVSIPKAGTVTVDATRLARPLERCRRRNIRPDCHWRLGGDRQRDWKHHGNRRKQRRDRPGDRGLGERTECRRFRQLGHHRQRPCHLGRGRGGPGAPATSTDMPVITASLGTNDNVNVTGNVEIAANSPTAEAHGTAKAYGVGGLSVNIAGANVTTAPAITADIGAGSNVVAGGDVMINATAASPAATAGQTATFDPSTDVNPTAGTIKLPLDLSTGAPVSYDAQGNTPVGGLQPYQIVLKSGVQFTAGSSDKITRLDGQAWDINAFHPGTVITVTGSTYPEANPADYLTYAIASVSGSVLTLTTSNKLVTATDSGPVTIGLPRTYSVLNPSISQNGLKFANTPGGGTITRPDPTTSWEADGFVAGATITIANSGGNDGTYTVASTSGNVLTLAAGSGTTLFSVSGTVANLVTITSQGEVRLGATFDPSVIDPETNTITFATPHGLQTGDVVVYDPQGGQTISGLTPGSTYYVRRVDDYTISLAPTLAEAQIPLVTFRPSDISNNSLSSLGFTDGQQVTYYGPAPRSFLAADIDVSVNATTGKFTALAPLVSLSNLTFANASGGATITRSDAGGEWTADGFAAGSTITVSGESGVDGTYTIAAVDGTTITLTSTSAAFTSPGTYKSSITIAQSASKSGVIYLPDHGLATGDAVTYHTSDASGGLLGGLTQGAKYYALVVDANDVELTDAYLSSSQLSFVQDAQNGDEIDLPSGSSWSTYGFSQGMPISVAGSAHDDGTYTVASVIGNTLTLTAKGQLTAGSDSSTIIIKDAPISISGGGLSDPAAVQSLTPASIGGLTDGQTYTVKVIDSTTGQFTLDGVTFDTTGVDPALENFFGTAGTVALEPVLSSSGPTPAQSFYVQLAPPAASTGTNQLIPAGDSLNLAATPSGATGVTSGDAEGGGGGLISVNEPFTTITITPVVKAYDDATLLKSTTGGVSITASSAGSVNAYAANGGAGFIGVNGSKTTVTQTATTLAFLGADGSTGTPDAIGVEVWALGGDFTLNAASNWTSVATSNSAGGAAFGSASSISADSVNYTTKATVGSGATVTVGENVSIGSDAQTSATTSATSIIVGVSVGAYADTDTTKADLGGVNIGSSASPALSQVEVGSGANVTGQTVSLKATQTSLSASATDTAKAFNPILFGINIAYADSHVAVTSAANVMIDQGANTKVTGTQGVDVIANQSKPTITRNPYAIAVAIIPPQDGYGSGQVAYQDDITAGAEATVVAGLRLLSGPLQTGVVDSKGNPVTDLALNVQASHGAASLPAPATAADTITWDANVIIDSGGQNATLTIDPNGMITQDDNVTVTDSNNNVLTAESTVAAGSLVNATVAAQPATAYFYGQTSVTNSANPLFTFNDALRGVSITNSSDRQLNVENIDLVPTDPTSEVRLDGPNLQTTGDTVPFNFNISHGEGGASIDIENIDPTQTASDITLSGVIDNPIGQTIIKNLRGNIDSTSASETIATNTLDIEATGDILPMANDKLYVQLIESVDSTTNATRTPSLTAISGGALMLETIARRRDDNTGLLTVTGTLSAAKSLTLLLDDSVLDGAPDGKGGILVGRPQQTLSGHYFSHFYLPDATSSDDFGMFANTSMSTLIASEYEFYAGDPNGNLLANTGLTAGGDINLTATDPTNKTGRIDIRGTMNMNPAGSSTTNVINATTYGDVTLTETSGAMRVGTIQSNGGNVTLATAANDPSGDDMVLGPNAAIYAPAGSVTANVADNFTMAVGSTISTRWAAPTKGQSDSMQGSVTINGDQGRTDRTKPGSAIAVSGQIWSPTESINGDHNDTIGLTNVTTGTNATVTTTDGVSTIDVGSITPFDSGLLDNIQGPLTVNGDGIDILNLDDTGDSTKQSAFLTATKLTGLGMAATGVVYTGLGALDLKLGTATDTVNVLSTASGTTSTITAQVSRNLWNIGSNAPTQEDGFVDDVAGPLILHGGGNDVMNVDDVGTANPKNAVLTDSTLTGLGAGPIDYFGMTSLTINLGSHGNTLTATVTNNLPATTNIDGGSSASDAFVSTFASDFNGVLNLTSFEKTSMKIAGNFNGALSDTSPGTVQLISVGGTMPVSGSIVAHSIDDLDIGLPVDTYSAGHDLSGSVTLTGQLSNLSVDGNLNSSIQEFGNITNAFIGGTIPAGVTLTATKTASTFGDIDSLIVGPALNTRAPGHDLAGTVDVDGHLAVLSVGGDLLSSITEHGTVQSAYIGGSIPESVTVNAQNASPAPAGSGEAGNVNSFTVGKDLAGTLDVAGTLGTLDVGNVPTGGVPSAGSITPTANVNVGGNLNALTVGPDRLSVGQNMAGTINVTGTLRSVRVAGGSPGLYDIGHVGYIDAYGGFGPVVLQVIEGGIVRHVELATPEQPYVQPDAYDVAGTNYVNVKYFYDSGSNASPQLTAQISNGTGSVAPDQYDLSTTVYNDAAKFNLDRLDAVGVSGVRNVSIEGDIVTIIGATAAAFFPGDASPAGVYLPSDALGDVATRDYMPNGSVKSMSIQAIGFGSYTNGSGIVALGSKATASDAQKLLAAGTAIVAAGSTNRTNSETFRVPFADLKTQEVVAFFLSTAASGAQFDPNNMLFTVEGVNNGLTVTPSNVARGAATALIGVSRAPGRPRLSRPSISAATAPR